MLLLTWMEPEAFWALLGLPLLWWLSRPPRPAAATATAHLDLWRRAELRVRRRRAPMWWRLLLLVIAWCAAILAWAGPGYGARDGFRRLVVLVDGSASMGVASAGQQPPWLQARQLVRAVLSERPREISMDLMVVAADGGGWYPGDRVRAWLSDPGEPMGAGQASLAEVAAGILAGDPDCRIWVIGDGRGESALPDAGERLRVTSLGAAIDNVSLDAVRCVDRWPGPDLELQADLYNHGRAPAVVTLVLTGPVAWRDQRAPDAIEIPAGEFRSVQLRVQRDVLRDGQAEMTLGLVAAAEANGWTRDDAVVIPVPPRPHPDVAIMGRPPAEVRAAAVALAALAGGRAVVVGPDAGTPLADLDVGCVLLEGGRAAALPRVASVWAAGTRVLAPGETAPPEPRPVRIAPEWDRGHPLLQGLDLADLQVRGLWRGTLGTATGGGGLSGEGGDPILWSGAQPLMAITEGPEGVAVRTAFRLGDSNLGLLPAWPRLLQRIWRMGHGLPPVAPQAGPGKRTFRHGMARGPFGSPQESRLLTVEAAGDAVSFPRDGGAGAIVETVWIGAAQPARSLTALALAVGAMALAVRMFGGSVSTLARRHPTR